MPIGLPKPTQRALLPKVEKQNTASVRRCHLANILFRERYLTCESLMLRVEFHMGFASFGEINWKANFYRDMHTVKVALKLAGYEVKYSRHQEKLGYYIFGEESLHPNVKKEIAGALKEIDQEQIEIYKHISPAQKFYQACSIINLAKKVSLEGDKRANRPNISVTSVRSSKPKGKRVHKADLLK